MRFYHKLNGTVHVCNLKSESPMSHLRTVAWLAAVLLLTLVAAGLIPHASTDPVSELSIQTSSNTLRAGSNNTVTMEVVGIGKLLSNLDVSLSLPQPLVLFGDNHWRRSSFGPGQTIRVELMIFAPASAAGNSYQATVTAVYKEAGETTYSQESHTIGFLVRGWIDIVIYDLTVTPDPVGPGSTLTVSGSLLNRGVTAAMFTNITIEPQSPLIVTLQGVSYLGQLDPNAPAPFSVAADVDPAAADGTYNIKLGVYYQDDLHMDQRAEATLSFKVSSAVTHPQPTQRQTDALSVLMSNLEYVAVIVVVAALTAIVLRRRRARRAVE